MVISSLPPPPAQFQHQISQFSSLNSPTKITNFDNSQTNPAALSSRRESIEALRANNEIDLNNDSISLNTLNQLTPKLKRLADNEKDVKNRKFNKPNNTTNLVKSDTDSNVLYAMTTTYAHLY